MNSKLKIRDASGWTIFNFGLLAFLFGLFSLIRPELLFSIFGSTMLSRASHKGKKIFYQDFSQNFYSAAAVKAELEEVQNVVTAVPQIGGAWCCVAGVKRQLADLLTRLAGQPLQYFDNIESAKNWLVEE